MNIKEITMKNYLIFLLLAVFFSCQPVLRNNPLDPYNTPISVYTEPTYDIVLVTNYSKSYTTNYSNTYTYHLTTNYLTYQNYTGSYITNVSNIQWTNFYLHCILLNYDALWWSFKIDFKEILGFEISTNYISGTILGYRNCSLLYRPSYGGISTPNHPFTTGARDYRLDTLQSVYIINLSCYIYTYETITNGFTYTTNSVTVNWFVENIITNEFVSSITTNYIEK
jgi:hypothetical protein